MQRNAVLKCFSRRTQLRELDKLHENSKCLQNAMILQGGISIETAKTFYAQFDEFVEMCAKDNKIAK